MTSRGAVDLVARAAQTRRAGHAGTLDPMATGVLLVCVGHATRLVSLLHELPKTYTARFRLGQTSDTDDSTGIVTGIADVQPPALEQITACLGEFTGRIRQVPPAHSAVHVAGERAYARARRGEALALEPRDVEVYRIDLVDYAWPVLTLDIECGSGTYIRSIGRDLGQRLGTGALMCGLERKAIGHFRAVQGVDPTTLNRTILPSLLAPPVEAVRHLPHHTCTQNELLAVHQGRSIASGAPDTSNAARVALLDSAGGLAAIGEYDPARMIIRPRLVLPT